MKKTNQPQVILITGCSSGFGLLMASRLSAQGHQVIATMRDLKKQASLLAEVKERGGNVHVLQLDVTDKDSIHAAVTEIGARYGNIDVLINNAGYGLGGFFEDLTDSEIRAQIETNFFGVLNVCRAVIPFMRLQRKGKIINISSLSGFSASPCFGAYNASKWALEGFSECLRYELSLFGIGVFLIQPGSYKTKIFYENSCYAKRFEDQGSPYFAASQHLKKRMYAHLDDNHKDPEEIAILAEQIIENKRVSFRSIPDIETKILYFFRKFLPFRIYSFIIQKAVFKDFKASI